MSVLSKLFSFIICKFILGYILLFISVSGLLREYMFILLLVCAGHCGNKAKTRCGSCS